MKTHFKFPLIVPALLVLLSTINHQLSTALAQGTAFTYQGQLQNNGALASGTYNLQFTLYTNSSGGTAIAGPFMVNGVVITNGLFTVAIDFGGSVWNGHTNWLQIGVESNGIGSFTTLTSRQQLTPVPYAIYSETASNLIGSISAVQITGGTISSNLLASFQSPYNTISGGQGNVIPSSDSYATIGGGQQNTNLAGNATIGGGFGNLASGPYTFIGGGFGNQASAQEASVGGGSGNQASGSFASVGGGFGNQASGPGAFIGGGGFDGTSDSGNTASGGASTVAGGIDNRATGLHAFIGGGSSNYIASFANSFDSTIGGGQGNSIYVNDGTIGGGVGNEAGNEFVFIGGGVQNTNSGAWGTIGGGYGNEVTDAGGFVGGGGTDGAQFSGNQANGAASTVAGGLGNQANLGYATVAGGYFNQASGRGAFVGGGGFDGTSFSGNIAGGDASTVGGGIDNRATGLRAFIGGGCSNYIVSFVSDSTISGGQGNNIDANDAAIGGGLDNQVANYYGTVSGGRNNNVTDFADYGVIGGGYGNQVNEAGGFVGGGGTDDNQFPGNQANGAASAVVGGLGNYANYNYSIVGGGCYNLANGDFSFIGGGQSNVVSGEFATIPGGNHNTASGTGSFAAGQNATAHYDNSFVWGDGSRNAADQGTNTFNILATGGIYLFTTSGGLTMELDNSGDLDFGTTTRQMLNLYSTTYGIGVQVNDEYFRTGDEFAWYLGGSPNNSQTNSGGGQTLMVLSSSGLTVNGTFVNSSDRNAKKDFAPVNAGTVLDKVTAMPITEWTYKIDPGTRHIGPMAQDFYAAFSVGPDDKHITTVDEGGVALAAIQGLDQKVEAGREDADAKIQQLETENMELKQRLEILEQIVLKQKAN